MSRVQLALNVSDLEAAVGFYSKLFATSPAKREPGYANFAIDDPPLKLVLVEQPGLRDPGAGGALNHLGVEVATTDEVVQASARLTDEGLAASEQMGTTCCFAVQDKVWVEDPTARRGRCTRCSRTPRARQGFGATGPAAQQTRPRHVADPSVMPAALWRRLLAEFVGSAFLAALVIGSGIAAQQLSAGNVGLELFENAAERAPDWRRLS